MLKLGAFLQRERRLLEQGRKISTLENELRNLKAQNERMRAGMRRCVTCEYRIDVVARREAEGGGPAVSLAEENPDGR